jgi:hypothetical protein
VVLRNRRLDIPCPVAGLRFRFASLAEGLTLLGAALLVALLELPAALGRIFLAFPLFPDFVFDFAIGHT